MNIVEVESEYPIIYISDENHPSMVFPDHVDNKLVQYSRSCISVGIQYGFDGPTTVHIVDKSEEKFGTVVFRGKIETPSKNLSVSTSEDEVLISLKVPTCHTYVEIRTNDVEEPDRVWVITDS